MVHQNLFNQEESKDFRQEHHKPLNNENPKIEPLFSRIWEGVNGKRTMKGSCIYPPTNLREKSLEIGPRKTPGKVSEIHHKGKPEELKQALRNHAESSIHTMKVHTRSSFRPIILPSHKISPTTKNLVIYDGRFSSRIIQFSS
jgi:hypothetical protein